MKKKISIVGACLLTTAIANAALVINTQVDGTGEDAAFPASFTPVSATDIADSSQSTFLSIAGTDLQGGQLRMF